MKYTLARRDGSEAEQLAWERLQTLVADYVDADALGRRAQATTVSTSFGNVRCRTVNPRIACVLGGST